MMRLILTLFLAVFLLSAPASAQNPSSLEFNRYLLELSEWNRVKPLQRPNTERLEEILNRNVTDQRKKTIGEVQGIVVNPTGSIASLETELDRLKLVGPVFLNVADMNIIGTGNSYQVGFDGDQIEEIFPSLLANIATAAGEAGSFSAESLIGQRVTSEDGRTIGTVENVIFNSVGARADALYVKVTAAGIRDRGIAVPFGTVRYFPRGAKTEVSVTKAQADAIVETARRR